MCRLNLGCFFLILVCSPLNAASLAVWPINPRIDAPASATMVWVKNNNANEEVVLQARILTWSQQQNQDNYNTQDELVVSPPLVTVQPGAQQVFRIVNRKGVIVDGAQELSYRLIIDEIPSAAKLDGTVLSFQMRYSLPLFVGVPRDYEKKSFIERQNAMAGQLRYRLVETPEKAIEIINHGKVNARLSKVKIRQANKTDVTTISEGLLGYVLVGANRQWPLDQKQWAALNNPDVRIVFESERQELEIAAH